MAVLKRFASKRLFGRRFLQRCLRLLALRWTCWSSSRPLSGESLANARIVVIKLDRLGDAVLISPLLRELRERFPLAFIRLVCGPDTENYFATCPFVTEVQSFSGAETRPYATLWLLFGAIKLMRPWSSRAAFDVAILPYVDAAIASPGLLAAFSGAPIRLGFSSPAHPLDRRDRSLNGWLTRSATLGAEKHEALMNLRLLDQLGPGRVEVISTRLEGWTSHEDETSAAHFFNEMGLTAATRIVALGIGASANKRLWPPERFVDLINTWPAARTERFMLIGGPADAGAAATIAAMLPGVAISAVGQCTIRQTYALLKRSALFIGNDSGPMHLAAAAGIPVVMISCHPLGAPDLHCNAPERFGPMGVPHRILRPAAAQGSCHDGCVADQPHCILAVDPSRVQAAALALMTELTAVSA